MLSWMNPIFALVNGLVSGLVGPLTDVWKNHQNVDLEKFKNATGYDLNAYQAETTFVLAANAQKAAANNWWGPRFLYILVGLCFSLHASLVALDSSFTFFSGHYGVLGIPKLPPDYFYFEKMVIASLFVVSIVDKPVSALASLIHRK